MKNKIKQTAIGFVLISIMLLSVFAAAAPPAEKSAAEQAKDTLTNAAAGLKSGVQTGYALATESDKQGLQRKLLDLKLKIDDLDKRLAEKLKTPPVDGKFTCPSADAASKAINNIIMSNMGNPAVGKSRASAYVKQLESKCIGKNGITKEKIASWNKSINNIKTK